MLIMGIVNSSVKPGTNHAVSSLGQAYWGGLLIIAAGVVGIFYSKKSGHGVLRGWTMALNIVLCFVLFIDMIIFGMGAAVCNIHRLPAHLYRGVVHISDYCLHLLLWKIKACWWSDCNANSARCLHRE